MTDRQITEFDQALGQRLRDVRVIRSMTQKELAHRLGITYQQVQKYERGQNRISADRLQEISEILAVPLAFLMRSDETGKKFTSRESLRLAAVIDQLPDTRIRASISRLVLAITKAWDEGV